MEVTPRATAATEVRVLIRVPRNSTQANRRPAPADRSRASGAARIAPTRPPESCRTAGPSRRRGAPGQVEQAEPADEHGQQPDGDPAGDHVVLGRRVPEQGQGQSGDQQGHRVGAVAEQVAEQQGHERPEPALVLEPDAEGHDHGEQDQEPLDVALVGRQALRELWPTRVVRVVFAAGRRLLAGAARRVRGRRVRALAIPHTSMTVGMMTGRRWVRSLNRAEAAERMCCLRIIGSLTPSAAVRSRAASTRALASSIRSPDSGS